MSIKTHKYASPTLVGKPLTISPGSYAEAELKADWKMAVDERGLIHGGFTFGLADYTAMIVVNEPNVVLAKVEVKFTAPVKVGDLMIARAKVIDRINGKYIVNVIVEANNVKVLEGIFTCIVTEKHVLDAK
ncbi:MAG: hotdog domain-containing protein [Candidatus Methanomethylicia archaeon]